MAEAGSVTDALPQLALLLLAGLAASTLAAVAGFGGAAILLPVLVALFGPRDAIPILTIAQLVGNGSRVVLNRGAGDAASEAKVMESYVEELQAISGQRPVVTRARRSIAAFKLREGMPIGCKVTLRGDRMYEFVDRLVSLTLPRVRDFRGVSSKGFDGRGNFNLGLDEQIIFPEIEYDKIDSIKGMNISIVTTADSDAEGRSLLTHLGMPFRQAVPTVPTAAPSPGAA